MSHHVTCCVTAVSYASSSFKKQLKKRNKINIKLEKLNKRKEKLSVYKVFHNKWVTKKEHNKDFVWIGQWKIWEWIFKKVGKELCKIEVSFFREEILKRRDDVRIINNRLGFILLFFILDLDERCNVGMKPVIVT